MPERRTLLSYLDDYAQRGGATVFVHQRGLRTVRWSYERLVQEANRFARELAARGVVPGERVLLCGENSPEWATAFWGCCLYSAVVVPLDKGSTPEFVNSVAQQTDAKVLVADPLGNPLLDDTSRLRVISLPNLTDLISHHPSTAYVSTGITEDTIAEIVYTSGTTSDPKGVVLTHRNLLANLRPLEKEIRKYLKWERFFHPIRF
ncbi:MAG TPA: class I adenylate-forming enzyme family protein, partial [Pyrinomonadaceae bacterium]|nr:class I adenylate-forming enzyme family protein [Pyrinomonadaceae bacterium]